MVPRRNPVPLHPARPALTRRAFSPLFDEARAWLRQEFQAAGLATRLDAGGNLVGARAGSDPARKPIVTGSHCDTVLSGGRYDGIIGVLAGIEVAHTLHEHGVALKHPFEVIDFLSEEPSDYGISCVGSRALSGKLDAAMLAARNPEGETLAQAIARVGGDPAALTAPLRPAGGTAAFVELHIEQGPVLEARGLPIGVVTNIVGIRRVQITVEGQPDHAGTTPMDIRRDAGRRGPHHRRRAPPGQRGQRQAPLRGRNGGSAVPDAERRQRRARPRRADAGDAQRQRRGAGRVPRDPDGRRGRGSQGAAPERERHRTQPRPAHRLRAAGDGRGAGRRRPARLRHDALPSGAGHDAMYMAPTGPAGMIFIPCLNGRSHCPDERIEPSQLLDGTRVLYETVLELDRVLSSR